MLGRVAFLPQAAGQPRPTLTRTRRCPGGCEVGGTRCDGRHVGGDGDRGGAAVVGGAGAGGMAERVTAVAHIRPPQLSGMLGALRAEVGHPLERRAGGFSASERLLLQRTHKARPRHLAEPQDGARSHLGVARLNGFPVGRDFDAVGVLRAVAALPPPQASFRTHGSPRHLHGTGFTFTRSGNPPWQPRTSRERQVPDSSVLASHVPSPHTPPALPRRSRRHFGCTTKYATRASRSC